MNVRRAVALVIAVGILGSQAGHLVAYQLLFGAGAPQVQSAGAHAYFPGFARTALGVMAIVVLSALGMVGVARIASGRRLEVESAPSFLRLLAALFTLQLGLFAVQETLESAISGLPTGSAADLMLWGTVGQLPVAVLAALAVRWLLARLRPAATQLRLLVRPVALRIDLTPALVPVPMASDQPSFVLRYPAFSLDWRGPPSF